MHARVLADRRPKPLLERALEIRSARPDVQSRRDEVDKQKVRSGATEIDEMQLPFTVQDKVVLSKISMAGGALAEGGEVPFEVGGDDDGERLTHLMLAARVRGLVDDGADLKEAFREIMTQVRGVISND